MSEFTQWLVVTLVMALIVLGLYVVAHQQREDWTKCPVPVPLEDCR